MIVWLVSHCQAMKAREPFSARIYNMLMYSKACVKWPLSKRPKIGFQDQLSLHAGQKYCRMQHSAKLTTFIKLPFVIKMLILSIFEWPFYTGFTVDEDHYKNL